MGDEKKYRTFPAGEMKLRDLLPLIRLSGYSNYDEGGTDVILCLECEEWTHVKINVNSGLLDLLGGLTITSISVDEDDLELWVKTDEYNWFNVGRLEDD